MEEKSETTDSFDKLLGKTIFSGAKILPGVSQQASTSVTGLENIWDCAICDSAPSETRHFYNIWASNYEEDMRSSQYRAPELLANYILIKLKVEKTAKILDVGCGTGYLGEELTKRGYTSIDGVDCSQPMLDIAATKNVYKKTENQLILANMTEPVIHVDYKYDCIAMCDAFQPGHITPGCLSKLIAILNDSGVITFCHRKLPQAKLEKGVFAKADFDAALLSSRVQLMERKTIEGYRAKPPCEAEIGYFIKASNVSTKPKHSNKPK